MGNFSQEKNTGSWKVLQKTEYLAEPMATTCYVTTQALKGMECEVATGSTEQRVAILDLEENVLSWLGGREWICEVELPLRVLPDDNPDLVKRLTRLPKVKCRVVPSLKNVLILGDPALQKLADRKDEEMTYGERDADDEAAVEDRLIELLEAARLAGMSAAGLVRAKHLVMTKARDVWRLKLGPKDVANLPAMPVELKADANPLPKPYMRKYTAPELAYWRVVIDEMLKSGIVFLLDN